MSNLELFNVASGSKGFFDFVLEARRSADLSDLSYRLLLQKRALSRPELHARSIAFHEITARKLASEIFAL